MLLMQASQALLTGNQVDECDLVLCYPGILQLLNTHDYTTSCSQHGIKNEDSLLLTDIIWELRVEHYRMFVFRGLISLDKDLPNRNTWKQVHDLPDHRVTCSNDGHSTVILSLELKLIVIVVLPSWSKPLFHYLRFPSDCLLDQQPHYPIREEPELEGV